MNDKPTRLVSAALLLLAWIPPHSNANAASSAKLKWTAPGDDGAVGRAAQYDIRLSTRPITLANFTGGVPVPGAPVPRTAGAAESLLVSGLPEQTVLYFAIRTRDEANNWSAVSNNAVLHPAALSSPGAPATLRFGAPAPNPASVDVSFVLELPEVVSVRIALHDAAGRRVRTLADSRLSPGRHDIRWDLRDESNAPVQPGVYFVLVVAGDERVVRRVTIRR